MPSASSTPVRRATRPTSRSTTRRHARRRRRSETATYTADEIKYFTSRVADGNYYPRGISVGSTGGKVNIALRNNSCIEGFFYGINIAGITEPVDVAIDDSRLDGLRGPQRPRPEMHLPRQPFDARGPQLFRRPDGGLRHGRPGSCRRNVPQQYGDGRRLRNLLLQQTADGDQPPVFHRHPLAAQHRRAERLHPADRSRIRRNTPPA